MGLFPPALICKFGRQVRLCKKRIRMFSALFALVDHSGEAEKVGLKMPATKLLIFGSPKAGTPLMLADPHAALDLPLKILVWEDDEGKVWLSYNSTEFLKERYGLPKDRVQNIAVVETLAVKAGE